MREDGTERKKKKGKQIVGGGRIGRQGKVEEQFEIGRTSKKKKKRNETREMLGGDKEEKERRPR